MAADACHESMAAVVVFSGVFFGLMNVTAAHDAVAATNDAVHSHDAAHRSCSWSRVEVTREFVLDRKHQSAGLHKCPAVLQGDSLWRSHVMQQQGLQINGLRLVPPLVNVTRVHSVYPSIKRLQRIIYICCDRHMFVRRLIKER